MHGWEVRSFSDLEINHHKHASTAGRSQIRAKFHLGCMDYVCGEMFLYSVIRALSLINKKPVVIGFIIRLAGYLFAVVTRKPQQIPVELKTYLRKEQVHKIKGIVRKIVHFK
jgi:hypothetical protein